MTTILPRVLRSTRILILDIERLPGLAEVWDQKTHFIPVRKWKRLPRTICFAWQWYGEPIHFESEWGSSHAEMVRRAWALYDEADIVVTYNGVSFDNRHLRSDWQAYQLGDPRAWKDVDLFRYNKGFGRVSYGLDHLGKLRALGGKTGHYDSEVAELAVAGDAQAQAELERYNRGDVRLTRLAYDDQRGMMPTHPHMGVADRLSCNQCGSTKLVPDGVHTAKVLIYQAHRCSRCGGRVKELRSCGRVAHTAGVR